MATRESLLDALNSIATSDFVRSVTAAGASSKVTVSNLAKAIVENYTGSTLAGSAQSVKSAIDAIGADVSGMIDAVYPVGSIYMSVNSTSPATLFGGTWVQIKGRFLLATGTPDANTDNYFGAMSGTAYSAGVKSKGGQDYHTLTIDEMPSHKHGMGYTGGGANGNSAGIPGTSVEPQNYNNELFINNKGGDQKHNNMPPYYGVYMWERTA